MPERFRANVTSCTQAQGWGIKLGFLLAFVAVSTPGSGDEPGAHGSPEKRAAVADETSAPSRSHPVAPIAEHKMKETIPGRCSYVHVIPSAEYPGRVRLFADVPVAADAQKTRGELYFCGGTIEQCASFQSGFDWVKPASAEEGKMAMSTFIPTNGEHVTILRVPPKTGPDAPLPCFEQVSIRSLSGNSGTFNLKATGVELQARTQGADPQTLVQDVKSRAEQVASAAQFAAGQPAIAPQPAPQPSPVQYQYVRIGRQWYLQPVQSQPQYNPTSYGSYGYANPQSTWGSSYQAIAQARADAMARQGILSHAIGGAPPIPGVSEGIGMSGNGAPTPTCFFTGPLLADASASGPYGTFRVRFFNGGDWVGSSY